VPSCYYHLCHASGHRILDSALVSVTVAIIAAPPARTVQYPPDATIRICIIPNNTTYFVSSDSSLEAHITLQAVKVYITLLFVVLFEYIL
jgi:hypothetical protein